MEFILVKMEIEKAFDSLFLILVLGKCGFGPNFLLWIEILLRNQKSSCGRTTLQYIKLEQEIRQGEHISAFLFILAFEILFLLIKENVCVNCLSIFDHCWLYSTYADDTILFLKDIRFIKEVVNGILIFSHFWVLKSNLSIHEIAGIGVLNGVKVAHCGNRCVNLKFRFH